MPQPTVTTPPPLLPPDLPPGARVVLLLPSGDELAAALLEALERELVAVPLDPRTEPSRVEETVDRVDAAAVLDGTGLRRTGRHAERSAAAGLALIMFTSGSTGRPKGVMLPREAVLANARHTAALHRFGPERPHATCLPLFHCNALVMSLYGTHLTGTPLVLHPRFDPAAYLADLDERAVATASIVPALLPELLEVAAPWPHNLDYLITAAAPLTRDLAHRFHAVYGPRLRQGYGLTELMNFSFTTPELGPDEWSQQYLAQHPPVGAPLPGTELRLVEDEVWIRSADRMRGYWDDPHTTSATVTDDGWLRTGDLGHQRDGLLVLDGRRSERIDRGGEKYYPLDVERSWRAAGLTGPAAAVPVPDDVLGHEIGLVTAGLDDAAVALARRLLEEGPRRPGVVELGGYTATATGKPQRTAMGRRLAAGRCAASAAPDAEDRATIRALGAHTRLADTLTERLPGASPAIRVDRLREPGSGPAERRRDLAAATTAATDDAPLLVVHGPDEDRWDLVAALREAGAAVVGVAVVRAGRRDLGGVVWARASPR